MPDSKCMLAHTPALCLKGNLACWCALALCGCAYAVLCRFVGARMQFCADWWVRACSSVLIADPMVMTAQSTNTRGDDSVEHQGQGLK